MNSPLCDLTALSPHTRGPRSRSIDRITIHCVVGQASVESLGAWFQKPAPVRSCNYAIGNDGRIVCIIPENEISCCSSSYANDARAVTIECASDTKEPYAVNKRVYSRLVDLCTDICKRNGKTRVVWLADKAATMEYAARPGDMVFTVHRWFAATGCPGDYLYYSLDNIAKTVTNRLTEEESSMIYETIADVPAWAAPTIQKLCDRGVILGDGDGLNLSQEMARILVMLDRAGVFKDAKRNAVD